MSGPAARQVPLVAVIDGNDRHRGQVAGALVSFYRVVEYVDAGAAAQGFRAAVPDLALVDEEVRPNGGYELVAAMRRSQRLHGVPVVVTSNRPEEQIGDLIRDCGADAFLAKPYWRSRLIGTVTALLNARVEAAWAQLPDRPRAALQGTVSVFNGLADAIDTGTGVDFSKVGEACTPLVEAIENNEYRGLLDGVKDHDNYTFAHSLKVATLLSLFGHTIGLDRENRLVLAGGGLLHDVGKMTIPHHILNKPGQLLPQEFEIMKSHVTASQTLLDGNDSVPRGAMIITQQHHEKLDGSGYPRGLRGRQLNELARMASIVDVFGALTDRRVYKPALAAEAALEIMGAQMADHLDQHFLKMFKGMMLDAVGG